MFSLICAWINAWVNNREAGNSQAKSVSIAVVAKSRSTFVFYAIFSNNCFMGVLQKVSIMVYCDVWNSPWVSGCYNTLDAVCQWVYHARDPSGHIRAGLKPMKIPIVTGRGGNDRTWGYRQWGHECIHMDPLLITLFITICTYHRNVHFVTISTWISHRCWIGFRSRFRQCVNHMRFNEKSMFPVTGSHETHAIRQY